MAASVYVSNESKKSDGVVTLLATGTFWTNVEKFTFESEWNGPLLIKIQSCGGQFLL